MQGRVLPASPSEFQIFPENWVDELKLINKLGFYCIELLDDKQNKLRKLLSEEKQSFFSQIEENNLHFDSICMDYLAKISLLNNPQGFFKEIDELMLYFENKENLIFVIPFFDNNFIEEKNELEKALEKISKYDSILKERKQFFSLEIDMSAEIIKNELIKKDLSNIKICYDTGNRINAGVDLTDEINVLGQHINHVHIKDKEEGKNIRLRENNTKLHDALKTLKKINYKGFFILETNPFPNAIKEAELNLKTIKRYLEGFE